MDKKTLYTRCPTCTTAFKVTDQLLSAAGGKVRCGACLAIFQATDYMLEPTTRVQPASPLATYQQDSHPNPASGTSNANNEAAQTAHSSKPNNRTETNHSVEVTQTNQQQKNTDDRLTDEDPEIPEVDEEDFLKQLNDEISEHHLSDNSILDTKPDTELDTLTSDDETHDESLSNEKTSDEISSVPTEIDILADNEPIDQIGNSINDFLQEQLNIKEPSFEESEFNESEFNQSDFHEPEIDDAILTQQTADDDLTISQDRGNNINENEEPTDEDELDTLESLDFDDVSDFELDDFNTAEEEHLESTPKVDEMSASEELSGRLSEQMRDTDIEPDPLDEFSDIVEEKQAGIKTKLGLAVIAILLTVSMYQIWSNRQALAWSETWGHSMKAVCGFLPCDLKLKRDVGKIRILQRQLTPDEEQEDVFDIKLLLINEAEFDQPYPTIRIVFSNKNDEDVAEKSFTPADYLDTNALNELMPLGSEVHIHFKTPVTHPDALGFEFIFE